MRGLKVLANGRTVHLHPFAALRLLVSAGVPDGSAWWQAARIEFVTEPMRDTTSREYVDLLRSLSGVVGYGGPVIGPTALPEPRS